MAARQDGEAPKFLGNIDDLVLVAGRELLPGLGDAPIGWGW
jgi:hypothetical protein